MSWSCWPGVCSQTEGSHGSQLLCWYCLSLGPRPVSKHGGLGRQNPTWNQPHMKGNAREHFLWVMRMVLLPNIGFSFYRACAVLYFPWAFHILEAMFIFFLSGEVFVIPTLIQSWFGMCYEPIEHFLFLKIMFFYIHMYHTTVDPILMLHMVHLLGISHCAGNHFYLHMNVHINYIILTFYKFTILPVIASTVRHGCLLPRALATSLKYFSISGNNSCFISFTALESNVAYSETGTFACFSNATLFCSHKFMTHERRVCTLTLQILLVPSKDTKDMTMISK